MLKYFFKIAYRNLVRNKVFSFINIVGLSFGLAAFLLIFKYIYYEQSFDDFHSDKDRLFRVTLWVDQGADQRTRDMTPFVTGPYMAENYAEIEEVTRVMKGGSGQFTTSDKNLQVSELLFTDDNFFKLFDSYELISGQKETVLSQPENVVISESTARMFFGDEDPIGKSMKWLDNYEFVVMGVMKDFPDNTHLEADVIIPMKRFDQLTQNSVSGNESWMSFTANYTYVKLFDAVDTEAFTSRIKSMYQENLPEEARASGTIKSETYLQPINDIHLYSNFGRMGQIPKINPLLLRVRVLSAVGLFILFLAAVNYINLVTAVSVRRAKEIGVKKVVGATRNYLVWQFLFESVMVAFISSMIAFSLVQLIEPYFMNVLDVQFITWDTQFFVMILGGFSLIVGVLAGLYPALVMSGFSLTAILKGTNVKHKAGLKNVLVVSQFAIAAVLIIASVVFRSQLQYIADKDLGYDKSDLITIPIRGNLSTYVSAIKNDLNANPLFTSVTTMSSLPLSKGSGNTFQWTLNGEERSHEFRFNRTDGYTLPTMKATLLQGRFFDPERYTEEKNVIINKTGAETLGYENPLGESITILREKHTIVGVIEDYHFENLRIGIKPQAFLYKPNESSWALMVRYQSGKNAEALTSIRTLFDKKYSDVIVNFNFLEDQVANMYAEDQQLSTLIDAAFLFALIISCLGLYGLALSSIRQKLKEVVIRKILGASIQAILIMFSKSFAKVLAMASLIAIPLAYWLMNDWLSNFKYALELNVWHLVVPCILLIAIGLATTFIQSFRASVANMAEGLREE